MPRRRRPSIGRRTQNAEYLRRRRSHSTRGTNPPQIDDVVLMKTFIDNLNKISYEECNNCKELHFIERKDNYVCSRCVKTPLKFSGANKMDPGIVPPELTDLTH